MSNWLKRTRWWSIFVICPPPARWGSLDFTMPCSSLPPPSSPSPLLTSTAHKSAPTHKPINGSQTFWGLPNAKRKASLRAHRTQTEWRGLSVCRSGAFWAQIKCQIGCQCSLECQGEVTCQAIQLDVNQNRFPARAPGGVPDAISEYISGYMANKSK